MKVILSAPHALCTSSRSRNCDLLAGEFARMLKEEISKRNIDVELFIGDVRRVLVDLNRKQGRETEFRKNLDKSIEDLPCSKSIRCNDVVIDVHSAPQDALCYPYKIPYPLCYRFESYMLEMESFGEDDDFNEGLFSFLSGRGIMTHLLQGTNDNDIAIRSIRDFGVRNVSLVEINETLGTQKMKEIASIIAEYIATFA